MLLVKYLRMFIRFDTTHKRDGHTDTQTHTDTHRHRMTAIA